MKTQFKISISFLLILVMLLPVVSLAITEVDNEIMKIYATSGGLEMEGLKGFDIQGYVVTNESTNEKKLISSTFGNYGYHTFLNVDGKNGVMSGELKSEEEDAWKESAKSMQYTAYDSNNEWQNIDGIDLKVNTQFINDGEQLQIVYTLKNTNSKTSTFSLATSADVEIDDDDRATIERLDDGSGVRLWTKEGNTKKPVQFVFYGKGVEGTTDVDNLWIGYWGYGENLKNMFVDNSDVQKIEEMDSSFAYSWTNRTIKAGETQTYSVLMEVGEVNIPNTELLLDNNSKFYYKDVKLNGTVLDKDLKDKITVHYVVDGTEYTLPTTSTDGDAENFTLDLTSLNLEAVTPHTLKVWATDSTECNSNVEERTFSITYLKEPEVLLSNTEWTTNATFRITDTVNEEQWVEKYQYRINDGEWVDCLKDTDIPVQENGIVKIDVRIKGTHTDDYSNIITVNAKIDTVNPTNTKPTATKTTCSITVNLEQTDEDSGIDESKTMYAIKNGETWSQWQSSNTFTGLNHNSEYVIKTKAVDKNGNTAESEESTIKTDELLLGDLILKLNNAEGKKYIENTWINENIYVAVEEKSIGATTKYKSKENSAQTIAETNNETTVTKDGQTVITLSVTDGTNTIKSDVEYTLKIDKELPIINELSSDKEDWTKDSKNVTGKAIDKLSGIVAYQFSNKDDLTSTSSGWVDVTATNDEMVQTHKVSENGKVYFYVKDAAGNIASKNIDIKIDSKKPEISFSRENGKTTIKVSDTESGIKNIQYAWTTENTEPTEWKDYSSAVTYTGSTKDKIYLWAKATDNAGNTAVVSSTFSTLRRPSIVSDSEFVNKDITFKLTSETEDTDVQYQFKIDDGEWQNINKDTVHTISDAKTGTVKISARILDNAGRTSDVITKNVKVSKKDTPTNNTNNTANKTNNLTNTNTIQATSNNNNKVTNGSQTPHTGDTLPIVILGIVMLTIMLNIIVTPSSRAEAIISEIEQLEDYDNKE